MQLRTAVADTAALVSLAIPKADNNYDEMAGVDPLRDFLTSCTVFVPTQVERELKAIAKYNDLDGAAAETVLAADSAYNVEDPLDHASCPDSLPEYGLGMGETAGILLANNYRADALVTDEFGSKDYAVLHAHLDLEGPLLLTTPRLIREYARNGHLSQSTAREVLDEITRHRWGESSYVATIREKLTE